MKSLHSRIVAAAIYLAAIAALAGLAVLAAPAALADDAANKGRAALRDCVMKLPLNQLADENAIAKCLEQGQRAAEGEDKRRGQIEYMRRIDEMDRMIERTTRGSRR
jgi:hypothetical protein